jgi:hypothetical protein
VSVLRTVPAVLASWILAAHFFRAGHTGLVVLCLALPVLLVARRAWATRLLQGLLLLGALEWVRTLAALARTRQAMGEPWERMAVILGGVAAFTALSALLLRAPRRRPPAGAC